MLQSVMREWLGKEGASEGKSRDDRDSLGTNSEYDMV